MSLTLEGSSLKLLKPKERGTVTRIDSSKSETVQKLRSMNITIGTMITVEQRSPRFLLRVGSAQVALNDPLQDAIYVRLSR
ncbi:FeoA family protein [Leptolyngbya sp. AN03gr2]|uniref:FeoA family protein n=1 Tax=unclassified Leptolyngbya TaxID=2650499 RepID=UPI003D311F32